jgi:hypothetical protein
MPCAEPNSRARSPLPLRAVPGGCRTVRRHEAPALIAIIFLIGCATGGVTSQLVVPPARAGTSPTRWEHFCATVGPGPEAVTIALNAQGGQGWDLVSVTPNDQRTSAGAGRDAFLVCSKRALP